MSIFAAFLARCEFTLFDEFRQTRRNIQDRLVQEIR